MFYNARAFNQAVNFDTSSVTSMEVSGRQLEVMMCSARLGGLHVPLGSWARPDGGASAWEPSVIGW